MSKPKTIEVVANGKTVSVASGTALPDFLESINLALDRVIVERNRTALTPKEASATMLKDGDTLEIVRIVGGG